MKARLFFAVGVLCAGMAYASYAQAQAENPQSPYLSQRSNNQWVVNFNDTDINTVIGQIAKLTGENYVIASNVTGKVNVISQTPLSKEDISELLRSVLYANGFSITNTGKTMVIRPSDELKKNKLPIDSKGKVSGEAFITRVISVKYANPNDLMQAVQPLVSDFAVLKSLPDSNALLIADKADNVQKVAQLIAELDYPETDNVQTIKLTKSWVGNVMPLLEKLAPRELSASGNRATSPIRVVGDEHNNSIMLKGDRNTRAALATIIAELDQSSDDADSIQVITLHNADATKTADILKDMFTSAVPNAPPVFIKANPMTNALVVHAPPATVDQIRKTLSQLDIPRPQVMIEAVIVEISDTLLDELGIQFGGGDAGFSTGLVATSLGTLDGPLLSTFLTNAAAKDASLVTGGLTATLGSGSKNFAVLIKALSSDTRANLLSTPSITTVANEEAKILVGQNVPFLTGSYAQSTTTTGTVNPFSTIQRQDIGVTLKVTPQINAGKRMTMKIEQEVSSISPTAVSGASDIITNKRSLNTTIMAENGQTVVLGGLISNDTTLTNNKIPILGDIPIIGNLFQANSDKRTKNNLLVFLRPTILVTKEDNDTANLRRYNGIWELRLGEQAAANPLSMESMQGEMDKNYRGQFSGGLPSAFPWRTPEPPIPPLVEKATGGAVLPQISAPVAPVSAAPLTESSPSAGQ